MGKSKFKQVDWLQLHQILYQIEEGLIKNRVAEKEFEEYKETIYEPYSYYPIPKHKEGVDLLERGFKNIIEEKKYNNIKKKN